MYWTMVSKRNEALTNEVWNRGSYLSTRVCDHTVINTYAYRGFFIHIEFCVMRGQVVNVQIDDDLALGVVSPVNLMDLKMNLN